jgi:hypothetical protein
MNKPTPIAIVEDSFQWLKANYDKYQFFTERDIVWTLQQQIKKMIDSNGLPYSIHSDYPLLQGQNNRRHLCVDLAVIFNEKIIAVEFKYEPNRARIQNFSDILPSKIPVVDWGINMNRGVGHDILRLDNFITNNSNVVSALSVFIDEGGRFAHKTPHPGSSWENWGNGIHVLVASRHRPN